MTQVAVKSVEIQSWRLAFGVLSGIIRYARHWLDEGILQLPPAEFCSRLSEIDASVTGDTFIDSMDVFFSITCY